MRHHKTSPDHPISTMTRHNDLQRPGLLEMVWPFVVIIIAGIAGAFYSGMMLYLYETAALNKPEWGAFPTDGDMIFVRLLMGTFMLVSGGLVIWAATLGGHYAIRRKKDHRYDICVNTALGILFFTVVGIVVLLIVVVLIPALFGGSFNKDRR